MTPFDQWNFDGVDGNVLIDDLDVDDEKHQSLRPLRANGFAYVLDPHRSARCAPTET